MPRIWFSGPRILRGLIRPGVSFSGAEMASWFKKRSTPKASADQLIGLFRRDDGAILLAIENQNAANENAPGLTPVMAFRLPSAMAAMETRTGALVRLNKHVGADGFVTGLSVGQVMTAIESEAKAIGAEVVGFRITV
jgi:hypothetical protein